MSCSQVSILTISTPPQWEVDREFFSSFLQKLYECRWYVNYKTVPGIFSERALSTVHQPHKLFCNNNLAAWLVQLPIVRL